LRIMVMEKKYILKQIPAIQALKQRMIILIYQYPVAMTDNCQIIIRG